MEELRAGLEPHPVAQRERVGTALSRRQWESARLALPAAALAERAVDRPSHDGLGGHPGSPRADGRARPRHRGRADRRGGDRVWRMEAPRHVARALRRYRLAERARRVLHRRSARHLSVDAGAGGRAPALRPDRRPELDRHALAGRASGLQHAGDHAERLARWDARRRRHGACVSRIRSSRSCWTRRASSR